MYVVQSHPKVLKALRNIPKKTREKLLDDIESLAQNPRPVGCKSIIGANGLFRIRRGNYRIIYRIFEKDLLVVAVKVAKRDKTTYSDFQALQRRARLFRDKISSINRDD
jgi:mRNA interferase RelE/StbE